VPAALPAAALADLEAAVGPGHVLGDPEVTAGYAVDFTGRFTGATPAVVRPGSTAEVAAVVAAARRHGLALCLQGGNTGLVGGGVPLGGEVVVSLRRLDGEVTVDRGTGHALAPAGATLAALHAAAGAAGWAYGVDLAARDSATVGGTVATNAGGLHVVAHGDTRHQLLGVEAVLGTGDTVSHLGGLEKDNTGYHLPSLLCGAEGTLGVVTAVRLRLIPPAPEKVVALLAFGGTAPAVEAALALRRTLGALTAAELLLAPGVDLVRERAGLPPPFASGHPAFLLVEAAGPEDPSAALAAAVTGLAGVADVAVATDPARRAALWTYREGHTEAINALGPPHKLDVTLPPGALAGFVDDLGPALAAARPDAALWCFGHVAEGNVHVNITGVAPGDDEVDALVLERVAAAGGSISAEHGIGTAKRRFLPLSRSPEEIRVFRRLKAALDPDGVLNPAVLLAPA
jgi:FAD/FMN-containing dehydrogenase